MERVQVFGDAKMTMALLGCITQHGDILEADNDSCRFKQRKKAAENNNGLVRKYFPKNQPLEQVTQDDADGLSHRPGIN